MQRFACFVLVALAALSSGADWLQFRGVNGNSVASGRPPVEWTTQGGVAWKAEIPGRGVSSPIVVGDRIFVTCYSGYGFDQREPGDINDLKRHLVCVDRKSGELLWENPVG